MTRNVLVVMSDEHQARALGCAGHPLVQTPHLDALAASGTRFDRCWTPSPICVPARAAFGTGRWVHDIGAWDSVQAWAGEPTGWTHAMRDAGHDVMSFGKLHHRSAADDDGFTERVQPMFIAGGVGWLQGLPRRDPMPYPEAAELADEVGSGETTYTRYDRRITDAAVDWLSGRSDDSPPWVAFVSLVAPHYPLSAPDEFTDRIPLADVPPPEIPPVEPSNPAVEAMRQYFRYWAGFDQERTREARRAYFALCAWMDHNVGRVLAALDASGQRDDTLIVYTSDHGELLGNRGLWAKSFMYEDSVAVPMILNGPDVPAGRVVDTAVNLIDVAPTILHTAGIDHALPGRPLQELATEPDDVDRPAFSEYHDGGSITGSFAVRTGEWKYINHVDHAPELYNVVDDPDELIDLGTSPTVSAERDQVEEALRSIVDPDAANQRAFASQEALIEAHGGIDGLRNAFRFNHTPVPD